MLKLKDTLGMSITMPYKKDIVPYLDFLDGPSKELGVVNTILKYKK